MEPCPPLLVCARPQEAVSLAGGRASCPRGSPAQAYLAPARPRGLPTVCPGASLSLFSLRVASGGAEWSGVERATAPWDFLGEGRGLALTGPFEFFSGPEAVLEK